MLCCLFAFGRRRLQTHIDVPRLDRDDAAIVSGRRDFGRRLVGDCRE
jgi:hypothetical protein